MGKVNAPTVWLPSKGVRPNDFAITILLRHRKRMLNDPNVVP